MRRLLRPLSTPLWLAVLLAIGACAFLDPFSQGYYLVLLTPRDTALYVGARFQARGLMVNEFRDQYASTHFLYAGLDSAAAVDAGGTVIGVAYGRARIVVTRAGMADTSWVSVVPAGTLVVSRSADTSLVGIVNLDGSGWQSVAPAIPYGAATSAWLPGNAGLVYESVIPGDTGGTVLNVADFTGQRRQLVRYGRDPRVSRDGVWVYFQRVGTFNIWRVHPDGSGLEQLTAARNSASTDGEADPSPDGMQLVFSRGGDQPQLLLRDLATGAERVLVGEGHLPRWAPGGGRIAFWKSDAIGVGAIFVVGPDGTGERQVSVAGREYQHAGLDWSADGQWLVARADSTLELIQVATGLTLPLAYSKGYTHPGWRR